MTRFPQAQKKRESNSPDYEVDYSNLVNVSGPHVVFSRLVVLASAPFVEGRGSHLLTFMQHFAPNINKHLTPLWDQRIPLLLHYLETHANFGDGVANAWDQVTYLIDTFPVPSSCDSLVPKICYLVHL